MPDIGHLVGQFHGGFHVQVAGAAGEDIDALELFGRAHQHRLDRIVGQFGMTLEEQRSGAADDASRHARAGQLDAVVGQLLGVLGGERGPRRDRAVDAVTRSDQVGLDHEVAPGRTAAGVGGHLIVAASDGVEVVDRTGGDHQGIVARSVDRHAAIPAAVTGRGHDGQARGPGAAHGDVDRIVAEAHPGRVAQGEVDDVDAILVAVGDDPVHGRQHVGELTAAFGVEDAQHDQVGLGGQALVARDDASDVGAVAETVVGLAAILDEIDAGEHALFGEGGIRAQARVDQGDRHAPAGVTVALPGDVRVGRCAGDIQVGPQDPVLGDRQHICSLTELLEGLTVEPAGDGAELGGAEVLAESLESSGQRGPLAELDHHRNRGVVGRRVLEELDQLSRDLDALGSGSQDHPRCQGDQGES